MGLFNFSHPVGRRAFFALLYFSEGAPIGYVWWAMPTRLRQAGMPVEQVGALIGLLTLPWALKFLWAPAVDRLRGPRWGYRCWITAAQLAMGAALIPLGLSDGALLTKWATILLLAHAFAAATQDVAIDAFAISTIPEPERGRTTGWMQAGMLVGRALFGGLALYAESRFGAGVIVFALVACIWFSLLVLWLMPGVRDSTGSMRGCSESGAATIATEPLLRVVARVARKRSTWLGLGVALTAGAGFEAVGGLIGPMLTDRGASKESIGLFLAFPVVSLMVLGGLFGGFAADRLGHRRLVGVSVMAIAACIMVLIWFQAAGVGGRGLMVAAGPMYFFIGSLTASSYALFMDLADPGIGGTQFSMYMSATNVCEIWAIALAGSVAGGAGYELGFAVPTVLSFAALLLIVLMIPPARTVSMESV